MKLRNWALIGIMLLVALGSAFYEIKLYLEKKKRIETLIVRAVSSRVPGPFTLEKIRFGFFSAHLTGVSLSLPAQMLTLTVDDITIVVSPLSLLRTRGALGRSIKKIVLVRPVMEYSVDPRRSGVPFTESKSAAPKPGGGRQIAIGHLLVKKGELRLRDRTGASMMLGEELQGRMWNTGKELTYELNGRLGAAQKNLFVGGTISWQGARHYLSLRLREAEIRRPISFKGFTLASGTLSGTIESSFPDTFSLGRLESNGWIRVRNGTCRIDSMERPIDSVNASISLHETRCSLDSLRAAWSCARIKASGSWNIAGNGKDNRFEFEGVNLRPDSLPRRLTATLGNSIAGAGWIKGTWSRTGGFEPVFHLSGGGMTVFERPVTSFSTDIRIKDGQYSVDSLAVRSPGMTLQAHGTVDNSGKEAAYSFSWSGAVDSLGMVYPALGGSARISGTVKGNGDRFEGTIFGDANEGAWSGKPVGSMVLNASLCNETVGCLLRGGDSAIEYSCRMSVSKPFSKTPRALCTLSLSALGSAPFFTAPFVPDSAKVKAYLSGWASGYTGSVRADIFSREVRGGVSVRLDQDGGDLPVEWTIEPRALTVRTVPVTGRGAGRWYRDSIAVDSLALFDRAVVTGRITLAGTPRVHLNGRFRFPLQTLFALGGRPVDAIEGGVVSGIIRLNGPADNLQTKAEVRVRDVSMSGFGKLHSDAIVTGSGGAYTVLPFVVRKDRQVVLSVDTISTAPWLKFHGRFEEIDLRAVFGAFLPDGVSSAGLVTGDFHSSDSGFPVKVALFSKAVSFNRWRFDSLRLAAAVSASGLRITDFRAKDGGRSRVSFDGFLPFTFLQGKDFGQADTLDCRLEVQGDLLKTLHHNLAEAIDGSGQGTVRFSLKGQPERWKVREASFLIPRGKLLLQPFIPGDIKNFSCIMSINDSSRVSTVISGSVGKRTVRIFSSHHYPGGYEPIVIGPMDFGILQMETPQKGIDIHLPGLMEKGETGDLQPAGRKPLRFFSVSGPVQHPTVSGTLLLRDVEFTFPMLKDGSAAAPSSTEADEHDQSESRGRDALSMVRWELDVKAANRKVMYFRNISNKSARFMRFLEGYIDQGTSVLRLRGSNQEKNLKISGLINSYHGAVYYGKTFDRNFQVTLEFVPHKIAKGRGYDNLPILQGSVEAFADTSRFDRIKLTALIQDPKTGVLSEKGRLSGEKLNVVFHLSSDFEELPGVSEREFYRQAGLQFTTLGGAGKFMSDFGEQYLHRFFLHRFERRLAKSVGLDVINIETSIASNYFNRFYNRQLDELMMQADYLALANVGVTVGRYFFRDNLFVRAKGGLLPVDTALTPQYSLGLEFQPTRYLFMDFDYGFYKGDIAIAHNPRLNLQLRLPITGMRNLFDF